MRLSSWTDALVPHDTCECPRGHVHLLRVPLGLSAWMDARVCRYERSLRRRRVHVPSVTPPAVDAYRYSRPLDGTVRVCDACGRVAAPRERPRGQAAASLLQWRYPVGGRSRLRRPPLRPRRLQRVRGGAKWVPADAPHD